MTTWLYNFFDLEAHDTTVGAGFLCSTTTFLTLSYIIFVQSVLLSAAGMDLGAVLTATCLGGAISSALMGVMTNYPIAMGHNFFFAFTVCRTTAAGG